MKSQTFPVPALFMILMPQVFGITYTYDFLNRLTFADYGNGQAISYGYDTNGNRTSRTVTSDYRLITVTVPDGGGTVTGSGVATVGSTMTLSATPGRHRRFGTLIEGGSEVSTVMPYTFVVSSSRSFEATFPALDAFTAYVTDYGLDPATNGAPLATPAGDGISNLMKFALGADPTVADPGILPVGTLRTIAGTNTLVIDFDFSAEAASAVTIEVEYSPDLVAWSTATNGQAGVTITTSVAVEGIAHRTVTIPASTPRAFARLRVSK